MFADVAKMAAKGAAILAIIAMVIVLFTVVTIPTPQWGNIVSGLNNAYAVIRHWCPVATTLLPIGIQLITLEIVAMGVELGGIAIRWVFKINE